MTLTEVMFAVFLTSVAVMVFGTSFPGASQLILRTRHAEIAAAACESQLELYREVGYASLPAIPSGATQTSRTFTPPADLRGGAGTVTFTRVDSTFASTASSSRRIRVEATATWAHSGRDRGSVTLTTLVVE